ncbi:type II toxin-antitoxin system death-on-curing family toxin [Sulfitobacter sp. KE34]|uniref:Type II toxin-antitoxin system death-on-curing family toxin n=1 Tax=Sulfitobacter faviae TaxID=1775881 RepID=A0AAX3LMQ4_9RHOB|nr:MULTISPECIES: type II toxin-antitoxin system death-on-curing family toxin [Sulfitobacter]MDF3348953.1 type II toxin-antitoxin system death-on-curing family toxin [Sulfitobacter sp. KE12]MDF3352624.1 type II toxin-antitoxin system death-on-curing family toxin [Sulfitobacter sp. KE27]MDF3356271.1 type II toxin-antitoxin system death-on-curing family toxin [Sulfitobacter sp. KE33]MDF3360699.1 type II toxin-antitoxin system death-on-curing family toxin [Sulfitobacter sp. Ks41]MDF3363695.1 type |tara:strand:- start:91 stop:468 length:378 start_codon:yes stop_codon:yes gene_type:complete
MTYVLLSPDLVVKIHDSALNPGELAGMALDKSLEGALARVDNRLVYGMIEDVFDLAAAYCVAVATGHVFNDANKRTAHLVLDICLDLNGVQLDHETIEAGDLIREVAQGRIDEETLADWLRAKAG